MVKKNLFAACVFVFLPLAAYCLFLITGCGQQSSETAATTTTTTTTSTTTVTAASGATISGQIGAASSDLVAASMQSFTIVPLGFRTLANTGVADATVRLYSVGVDGTETDTGKIATADASGNYTITGVTPLTAGIYRIVAVKTINSNTLQVSSPAIIDSITNETVNVAPETTIADKMFEGIIKAEYGGAVRVEKDTMQELKDLVVDDTENLVTAGKLALPSMLQGNSSQVVLASAGMGDNQGNSEQAFKKLDYENLANSAITNQNLGSAMRVINEMTASGLGANYLPAEQANRAFGQALLEGKIKTITEIIDATNGSLKGGSPLNTAEVVAGFQARLSTIETKYERVAAGTAQENIIEPEFYAFTQSERLANVTATATLDVIQQIALKNYIKQNFAAGATLDDINLANQLGYISAGMNINTTTPSFDDYAIYYGYYSGKQIVGSANVRLPGAYVGLTVNSVVLMRNGSIEAPLTAESSASNNTHFRFNGDQGYPGPNVSAGTYTYTLRAALSDGSSAESAPITLEVIEIPEPNIYFINGTALQANTVSYYPLPATSDRRPIFVWSTAEVAGVTLPSGFGWGYAVELNRLGTQNGVTTLEIDTADSTNVYNSGTDLGSLSTNASFLCPVDLTNEVSSEKVGYRFYLQRVLLNAQGKYNGIAAGAFRLFRYTP